MVVQHNLQAMNSNRMLNQTTKAQSKSTEKLSSGYKINRAADDAAGLAISEKMRKQIRGLDQASSNCEDGISCVQTAEGALTEVQDMIQRMNELAVQAANGTNSQSDREAIQNEITQLTTEIDRVAETTKFNEIYLLKGDPDGTTKYHYLNAHDAGIAGTLTESTATNGDSATATFVLNELTAKDTINIAGKTYTIGDSDYSAASLSGDYAGGDYTFKDGVCITDSSIITAGKAYAMISDELAQASSIGVDTQDVTGTPAAPRNATASRTDISDGKVTFTINKGQIKYVDKLSFNLHVGSDATMSNKIQVDIDAMSSNFLGLKELDVVGKDDDGNNIDDGGIQATYAIDAIAEALTRVSSQRSLLGAAQNRLEHTVNNLDNVVENTTSAESRIRDTDMAEEMVEYSKSNILAQAGQSMLAQANQSTQGVMNLLQ